MPNSSKFSNRLMVGLLSIAAGQVCVTGLLLTSRYKTTYIHTMTDKVQKPKVRRSSHSLWVYKFHLTQHQWEWVRKYTLRPYITCCIFTIRQKEGSQRTQENILITSRVSTKFQNTGALQWSEIWRARASSFMGTLFPAVLDSDPNQSSCPISSAGTAFAKRSQLA